MRVGVVSCRLARAALTERLPQPAAGARDGALRAGARERTR
jgi:hypothetical protein